MRPKRASSKASTFSGLPFWQWRSFTFPISPAKFFLPVQNPVSKASSCLGPKLIPLSIELDHLEQGQGTTTTLAPTHPFSLLACPHSSIQRLLHPPAAYGLARLRPPLIVNDLRSMLL